MGVFHCVMSANELSPIANHPLKRIQKASALLRMIFFISTVVFGLIGVLGYGITIAGVQPGLSFYLNFSSLGHAVECWFAYKLFSNYVNGDLFDPKAICWIRWIGITSLLMGGGNIWNALLQRLHDGYFQHINSSPLIVEIVVYLQLMFFNLVHNLVFGLIIILVAWIMDEGRKIQEEQELTV